jgi:hypothetical protein
MLVFVSDKAFSQVANNAVILTPSYGQKAGNIFPVRVYISSTAPIDTVYASVVYRDQQNVLWYSDTGLVYEPATGYYSGFLSIAGFPNDTLNINVHARYSTPNSGYISTSITILHDSLLHITPGPVPQVMVSQPLPYSLARPLLYFKAKAGGSTDSCRLILSKATLTGATVSYSIIGTYLDSIDAELDLSPYEGTGFSLIVEAIDKNNQTATSGPIPVFVESSPYLKEYRETTGKILDFNYGKILIIDDGPASNPRIVDATTGNNTYIPYNGHIETGYLTPLGAIFISIPLVGLSYDSLYDYNNGNMYALGKVNKGSVKVAGNYCIWAKNNPNQSFDSLFLRDLVMRNNSLIAHNAVHYSLGLITVGDVTASGIVVYSDSARNLTKYENNTYTVYTAFSYFDNTIGTANPLTDGHNIAYQQKSGPFTEVLVRGEQGNARLYDALRGFAPEPYTYYQVNNKYVAHINIPLVDPLHSELRLRDTTGASSLIQTGQPNQHKLDLLNPLGEIMFFKQVTAYRNTRMLAPRSNPVIQISSDLGKSYYRDSDWYIAIGRTLLKINLTLTPERPVLGNLKPDYCSNENMQKIKITNFPGQAEGVTTMVQLDQVQLAVAVADSSFSFYPANLSAGTHTLIITFGNLAGVAIDTQYFNITAAVTPLVKLSADITDVTRLTGAITLTATNKAGGGTNSLYTFSRNSSFTDIIQESNNNTLIINSNTLALGINRFFVRMLTSEQCYTVQTSADSIDIRRYPFSGIIDEGNVIGVHPNPFKNHINITGLNSKSVYILVLYQINGRTVYFKRITNQHSFQILCPQFPSGIYFLTIFNETNKKLIGTVRLFKKHND